MTKSKKGRQEKVQQCDSKAKKGDSAQIALNSDKLEFNYREYLNR